MHHAIDSDDVEAYQKYSKVYDSLMKSGKFTAAQNKEAAGEFVDSLGELFALCERDGYVERYYVDQPNDKVDETILDMKRYTRSLVDGESNLSNLIERAIRENQKEDLATKESRETEIVDADDMTVEDIEKSIAQDDDEELSIEDYADFSEMEDEAAAIDAEFYKSLGGDE